MVQSGSGMRPLKSLISLDEALKIIMDCISPVKRVRDMPLERCLGHVLAEDVTANIDVPPFSRAAEDGFALRAEESFGATAHEPRMFNVVGRVDAGDVYTGSIKERECVQIATGAPIPEGANAVVRVEDTEVVDKGRVAVYRAVPPGFDISPMGEDIKKGDALLRNGEVLTPSKIGVCAALGMSRVKVYDRPKMAVIPTGNEIVPPGQPLKMGQIYDVNSYTLRSVGEMAGARVSVLGLCGDSVDEIRSYLEGIKGNYDIVVFSGGSSVGVRDVLIDAIKDVAQVRFHGVAVKPGKPTWFATTQWGGVIFGMPGYPTSCLSDAYLFLLPAVRKAARVPPMRLNTVRARMGQRVNSTLGREQFFTVRLEGDTAYPAFKTSGAITSMAQADGYIMIPANTDLIDKGEDVEVHLFGHHNSWLEDDLY